ncbi:hypothetical protein [Xanthocytophaga agilis]|uniref:Uncharacterized protein n=1 Tax=Xanthocytophaga agilis TaxID=3048010 RepID=A0AAE3UH87_9BACT|nr:hypothetical protein [Xanthocytophaga agilis]MDJ1504091.1 hypothetical protein [Xanthocytophaga agilis]
MPFLFQEDKLKLTLEHDVLLALTDAIKEVADNLDINIEYRYEYYATKSSYTEIAMLRDLHWLHHQFIRKLETSYLNNRRKVSISLPISYIYLLHKQVIHNFNNHYLQQAIDQIDKLIKSYKFSDRLDLR